jgi:hypothetical protein
MFGTSDGILGERLVSKDVLKDKLSIGKIGSRVGSKFRHLSPRASAHFMGLPCLHPYFTAQRALCQK